MNRQDDDIAKAAPGESLALRLRTLSVCFFISAIGLSGRAHAQSAQSFELSIAPAANSSQQLVALPVVAVVPAGSAPIARALAAQLNEAVTSATQGRADADQFVPLLRERAGMSDVGWAFAARTDARAAYAALSAAFTDQLSACLHSLPGSNPEFAALVTLLAPAPLSNEVQLQAALIGGQLMLQNWKSDHCATQANSVELVEQQRPAILAAVSGMLTGEFDALVFRGQGLLDLIEVLKPLFFDSGGLWQSDRGPRLEAAFRTALEVGFVSTEQFQQTESLTFSSFFDWIIYMRRQQPALVRSLYKDVAAACLGDVQQASQPFSLGQCVMDGKLDRLTVKFGALERVTLLPRSNP